MLMLCIQMLIRADKMIAPLHTMFRETANFVVIFPEAEQNAEKQKEKPAIMFVDV